MQRQTSIRTHTIAMQLLVRVTIHIEEAQILSSTGNHIDRAHHVLIFCFPYFHLLLLLECQLIQNDTSTAIGTGVVFFLLRYTKNLLNWNRNYQIRQHSSAVSKFAKLERIAIIFRRQNINVTNSSDVQTKLTHIWKKQSIRCCCVLLGGID